MDMDDLEMCLDRIGICIESMESEKEEILGLILAENFFEAGMKWRDYQDSMEGLKLELSDARSMI